MSKLGQKKKELRVAFFISLFWKRRRDATGLCSANPILQFSIAVVHDRRMNEGRRMKAPDYRFDLAKRIRTEEKCLLNDQNAEGFYYIYL